MITELEDQETGGWRYFDASGEQGDGLACGRWKLVFHGGQWSDADRAGWRTGRQEIITLNASGAMQAGCAEPWAGSSGITLSAPAP